MKHSVYPFNFEIEASIIKTLAMLPLKELHFMSNLDDSMFKRIYSKASDLTQWVDESENGDGHKTPDFWSATDPLMMDLMRVDDTGSKRGRKNSELMVDSAIKKFLGYDPQNSPINVIINGRNREIPGTQDHNYSRYRNNVKRIINKHIKKIPQYQNNHPGFSTIFFVCDESTQYCITKNPSSNEGQPGDTMLSYGLHIPWYDELFMSDLLNSNVEYLIWFAPYKHAESYLMSPPLRAPQKYEFPTSKLAILDLKNFDNSLLRSYDPKTIVSCEA